MTTHFLNNFWLLYAHGQVKLNKEFHERDLDELGISTTSPHATYGKVAPELTDDEWMVYHKLTTDIDGKDIEGMKLA